MTTSLRPLSFSLPIALASLLAATAAAQPAQPLTMARIMADPDWIGGSVEQAWWSWDGTQALYQRKREGATIRGLWQVAVDGGTPARVGAGARAGLDAAQPVYDPSRTRMAYARNGDIFVVDGYGNARVNDWPLGHRILLGQNLHLGHHLWPSVPFYHYRQLNDALLPQYRSVGARLDGFLPVMPVR